jgi:hypothetical protein
LARGGQPMELTQDQASEALREVEAAGRRARLQAGYRVAAPILVLWGVIWAACFAITQWAPEVAGWAWLVGDALGLAATAVLGWWLPRRGPVLSRSAGRVARRVGLFWLLLFGFGDLWLALFWPWNAAQFGVFVVTLVMFAYVAMGLWLEMWFMTLLGAVVAALAAGGYFLPAIASAYLYLWLAVTGGGALLVSGLYMHMAGRRN